VPSRRHPGLDRREFLGLLGVGALAAGSAAGSAPAVPAQRRLVWNNDGDDLRIVAFGLSRLWNPRDRDQAPAPPRFDSTAQFLALRLAGIRDTPVDTVSYCGVFTWPVWDLPRERLAPLGPDPLLPVIDFVHGCGKAFWFNLRMNECHSSGPRWQGAAYWEPFRRDNLHLLQARLDPAEIARVYAPWIRGDSSVYPLQAVLDRRGPGNRDVQSWSAFDYARPEVRDHYLGLIRTACSRYDLDGIDLDWLRFPFFFRFGEERRGLPLLNDFVRRAAGLVRAAARRRGRPITLAVRVPDTPERALEVGLDVATWLDEGWVDVLIAGNGLAGPAVGAWRPLADPRRIPVLGCIARNAPGLDDPAAFRGACRRTWAQAADGLYWFNHFIPDEYPWLGDAADPDRLDRLPAVYAVDRSFTGSQNGTVASGYLPLDFSTCTEDARLTLPLDLPEDPASAASATLVVRWLGAEPASRTTWEINGQPAGPPRASPTTLAYPVRSLQRGLNRLRITVTRPDPGDPLVLDDVRVILARR